MRSPFEEFARSPVDFVCDHCGEVMDQYAGAVLACSCTASEDAARLRAAQEAMRPAEPNMQEIRRKNKVSYRRSLK